MNANERKKYKRHKRERQQIRQRIVEEIMRELNEELKSIMHSISKETIPARMAKNLIQVWLDKKIIEDKGRKTLYHEAAERYYHQIVVAAQKQEEEALKKAVEAEDGENKGVREDEK